MDGRVGTAPDTRSASVLDIAVIVAIIILWLSAAFLMNVRELLWDRSTSLLMEMTEQRALFLENYGFAERRQICKLLSGGRHILRYRYLGRNHFRTHNAG